MIKAVVSHLAAAVIVTLMFLGGALESIENSVLDARYKLFDQPASDHVVLVTIDSQSLKAIGVWPWPRHHYADVLDRLVEAGATRIALDIDFSSTSTDTEDNRLESALAQADGRVVLPAFAQLNVTGIPDSSLVFTEPLPRFAAHALIASVNFPADGDGTVRRMIRQMPWRDGSLPALTSVLASTDQLIPPQFYIDYGISSRSFRQVSFIDVLEGRFETTAFSGKTVIIGSSAAELGDLHQTPTSGYLPGNFIHALAIESVEQGRMLRRIPPIAVIAGILLIAFLLTPFCGRYPWKVGLAVTIGVISAITMTAILTQATTPVLIDIVPWALTAVLGYALGMERRISAQDLHLLAHKVTIGRKDAYLRGLVDATFDGIVTVNEEGLIQSANRRAEKMFGYAEDFLSGQPFTTLFQGAPASLEDRVAFLEVAVSGGRPREIAGLQREGGIFDAHLSVTRVPGDDRVLYILLILDVSGRRKAEEEAADTRQRLAEAIESISEGIVLWDANDRLSTCNKRYVEFHAAAAHILTPGCRFDEFVRTVAMLGAHPDAEGREREWIAERLARHRDPGDHFTQRTADGRWLRIVERRTAESGIIGVETDITKEHFQAAQMMRARNAAEAANRAKTKFLANMSHELRTPLNAILGFSELIRDKVLGEIGNEKYADYAHDIHRCGSELLVMIEDILEASRIESGTSVLQEGNVNPYQLMEDALRTLDLAAQRSDVRLTVRLDEELPEIRVDRRKIKQCFINIVGNAIRFSPVDACVTIRAHLGETGLDISVKDMGIGMTDSQITRALEPFGPLSSHMGHENGGLGLGLRVANIEIQQHGGRLDIDSRSGAGTTVTIHIPPARILGPGNPGTVVALHANQMSASKD